jgi:hypothetical protein
MPYFLCHSLRWRQRRKSSSSPEKGKFCCSKATPEGNSTPSSSPALPWRGERCYLHHLQQNHHCHHHPLWDRHHPPHSSCRLEPYIIFFESYMCMLVLGDSILFCGEVIFLYVLYSLCHWSWSCFIIDSSSLWSWGLRMT